MHRYEAYGLTLASDLSFFGASPGGADPDAVIRVVPCSESRIDGSGCIRCVAATPTLVRLEWGGVGELLVEGGRSIVVRPLPGAEEDALRLFVLGAGMGVLLHQRGLLVLHASSVCIEDQVICFVGGKGAGKSTTAALFSRSGGQLLSDELVVLQFDGQGSASLLPGLGPIKLWSDALRGLGWQKEGAVRVRTGVDKFAVFVPRSPPEARLLHRIYLLDYDETETLSPLSPGEAFLGLIPHLYVQRFGHTYLKMTESFAPVQAAAQLVKSVPVGRLRRRRDLKALARMVGLVRGDLRSA